MSAWAQSRISDRRVARTWLRCWEKIRPLITARDDDARADRPGHRRGHGPLRQGGRAAGIRPLFCVDIAVAPLASPDPAAGRVRTPVRGGAHVLVQAGGRGLTLATCTQPDLDHWKAGEDLSYRDQTGHFIRWASKNRLAKGLTFGAERWQGPVGPHDSEGRWDDARRLLHDATLTTADRVAGLLLLFYAQRLSTISNLTVDQVTEANGRVSIQLGTSPTVLPEPLAALVLDLIATRRAYTVIGHADQTPWLFPGQRPGQHISADRLGLRLIAVGIQPGQARSTALFALAEEVPAAILARMLGIHIQVAVQWQKASAGDWAAYADDVSRREGIGTMSRREAQSNRLK